MEKIITFDFGENFIERCAEHVLKACPAGSADLSRIACVFGGKRPALFLRRALAEKLGRSFFPPRIFSMDEFIGETVAAGSFLPRLPDLDAAYLIYVLAGEHAPEILEGRSSFSEFLPWAGEMVSFIEQLDLEDIDDSRLEYIEKSADIGYEVPESINVLLRHIIRIRGAFHRELKAREVYSRGRLYRDASLHAGRRTFDEYDRIFFCNFFYLHATERNVLKTVLEKDKGICLFQGSQDDWSVLATNAKGLGSELIPKKKSGGRAKLFLYRGFDIHSQTGLVRSVLGKIEDKENTLVMVPRPETVIPLVTEIGPVLDEFNVSMGYPLKRTSLYVLFDLLVKARESKKGEEYYTRDYIDLLRHPLIKNLCIDGDPVPTRVLIHKLEELLEGKEESSIGGSLFLSLDKIEAERKIYDTTERTLAAMGSPLLPGRPEKILARIHEIFLRLWDGVSTFGEFARCLETMLSELVTRSALTSFPFNLKITDKMNSIVEELSSALFKDEVLTQQQLWDIFRQKLEREKVAFSGSPLRGTQILGLFETRALDFRNVVVMDMNESVLPKLTLYEPLIPREVMLSLGLNRLEKEEEIQRYQFMRLISSAEQVHLIYEENKEKEKSRFIEELLWKMQKREKTIDVIDVPRAAFPVQVKAEEKAAEKTPAMLEYLHGCRYSASRINTYLGCPLKFYFKYVLGLKEQEDLLEDPQATHIGTFIHELLRESFSRFIGKKPLLNEKFEKQFFRIMEDKFAGDLGRRMKSDAVLLKKIIRKRLESFLEAERERHVARIVSLEEAREGTINIGKEKIRFTLTADRVDVREDGSLVIIDYKTGGADIAPRRLSSLETMEMTRVSIKEDLKSFQLPLYYYFISQAYPSEVVNAELYNIRTLKRTSFIRPGEFPHKDRLMDICLRALQAIFDELFDPDIPFVPDRDERACMFCPYRDLCR